MADAEKRFTTRLTPEQMKELRAEAEKYKAAQRQFTEAVGVLWNAQLNAVAVTGEAELLEKVLARPLGLWDDCNCC